MTTTSEKIRPLYVGTRDWALVCESCAGYTLQTAIKNAEPGQGEFVGANGEIFELVSDSFRAFLVEDFARYGIKPDCDCQASKS